MRPVYPSKVEKEKQKLREKGITDKKLLDKVEENLAMEESLNRKRKLENPSSNYKRFKKH